MFAFSPTSTFAQIWEQVRSWPPAERKLLMTQILESLPPESGSAAARAQPTTSAAELIGLWADIEPKPTNEDLKRILEDSIIEKHWS